MQPSLPSAAAVVAALAALAVGAFDPDLAVDDEPCRLACNSSSLPSFFLVERDDDDASAAAAAAEPVTGRAGSSDGGGGETRPLSNVMLTCLLRRPSSPTCSLDVLKLLDAYVERADNYDDDEVLVNLSLDFSGHAASGADASSPSEQQQPPPPPMIRLDGLSRPRRNNVIMLFTMINLAYSWTALDQLASLVNLVVLKLIDCVPVRAPVAGGGVGGERELNSLRSVMTLALSVSAPSGRGGAAPIADWLPAAAVGVVFPYMAELHVVCAATKSVLRESPNSNIMQNVLDVAEADGGCSHPVDVDGLRRAMPRLQALELSRFADVRAVPPSFPWHAERLRLPRNLARTPFFHSHYTNRNSVVLETSVYRRMLAIRGGGGVAAARGCRFSPLIDRVDLDGSGLADVDEDCFANATSLQYLKLNDNRLVELPPNAFASLRNLTRLFLHNNLLERIDRALFRDLTSLQYLNLASNRLRSVDEGTFERLAKLRYLSLKNNSIATIDAAAFPLGSTELSCIQLGGNRLTELPPVAFRLRNALALDLSDNEIAFDGLGRTLAEANLESARVYSVESISEFDEAGQLSAQSSTQLRTKIDLRRNRVRHLPRNALRPSELRNLIFICKWFELNLDENPISCDCHAYRFRSDLLGSDSLPPALTSTTGCFDTWKCASPPEARGASLFSAPSAAFSCAHDVAGCPARCECRLRSVDGAVVVDCRNRSLTALPSTLPTSAAAAASGGSGELIADFRHNKIETLSAAAADSLKEITTLLLSDNALVSVDDGAFAGMVRLAVLALDNNRLTSLPREIESARLVRLSLRSNFWPCDCHNGWMKAWLQRNRAVVEDLYQVTCTSSRAIVRGMPITEINDGDFVCDEGGEAERRALTAWLAVVVVLLALCVVAASLVYRYFGALKIILYVNFGLHPFDRVGGDDDPLKEFDVFLSYSSQDSEWVTGTLRRVLESCVAPPLKVCFHEKDFGPGRLIHDNILSAIRRSRRMVVVLSDSFVRSDWCMLEFRTAHEKVMKERGAYLVVVLLDDVDRSNLELEETLRSYLSTYTYLDVQNRWFWHRLLYRMPQKGRPRLLGDLPPPPAARGSGGPQ